MSYYDRNGNAITRDAYIALAESQRRVAETTLPNRRWVSTVWLGTDHRFGRDGGPLIFETMVFPAEGEWGELDCDRYSTEAEAIAGHARMCEKWAAQEPEA